MNKYYLSDVIIHFGGDTFYVAGEVYVKGEIVYPKVTSILDSEGIEFIELDMLREVAQEHLIEAYYEMSEIDDTRDSEHDHVQDIRGGQK